MRAASPYTDLVFHGLAFIPASRRASAAAQAACSYFPAYLAFVKRRMPAEAWQLWESDSMLLASLFEPVDIAHSIGLFAELHRTVDELLASAKTDLCDLPDSAVTSPDALRALQRLPPMPLEIFRANLALSAHAFAAEHERSLRGHAERCVEAVTSRVRDAGLAGVDLASVELSVTLGPRGRGFARRIVVGLDGEPEGPIDPDVGIVYAVHEAAVQLASDLCLAHGRQPLWADVEAIALAAQERVLVKTPLGAAHRRWLDAIDRSGLSPVEGELESLVREAQHRLDGEAAE